MFFLKLIMDISFQMPGGARLWLNTLVTLTMSSLYLSFSARRNLVSSALPHHQSKHSKMGSCPSTVQVLLSLILTFSLVLGGPRIQQSIWFCSTNSGLLSPAASHQFAALFACLVRPSPPLLSTLELLYSPLFQPDCRWLIENRVAGSV